MGSLAQEKLIACWDQTKSLLASFEKTKKSQKTSRRASESFLGRTPPSISEPFPIFPRLSVFQIFDYINEEVGGKGAVFNLKVSYCEVYNETINDLLTTPPTPNLKIREFPKKGMRVVGIQENYISSPQQIFECLSIGTHNKSVASTNQNERSSRSHSIFTLEFEQKNSDGSKKSARLNLVDLAGSERISKTGATGQTLEEAKAIGKSLSALGNCINALTTPNVKHIPYRDSKITCILKESLGGSAKTTLVCTGSRKAVHLDETISTFRFASRAKAIQNKVSRNIVRSAEEMQLMINQLEQELTSCRAFLKEKGLSLPKGYTGGAPSSEGTTSGSSQESSGPSESEMELRAKYDHLLSITNEQIADLKAKVEFLEEKNSVLSKGASAEEVKKMQFEMQEVQASRDNLAEEVSGLLAEKEGLVQKLRKIEEEITTLRKARESAEQEARELSSQIEGFVNDKTNLHDALFKMELTLKKAVDEKSQNEELRKMSERNVAELQAQVESRNSEMLRLREENQNSLKEQASYIQALENSSLKAKQEVKSLSEKAKALEKQLSTHEKEMKKTEREKKSLQTRYDALKQSFDMANEELRLMHDLQSNEKDSIIEKLKENLDKTRKEAVENEELYKATMAGKEMQISKIDMELIELRDKLKNEIQEKEKALSDSSSVKSQLHAKIQSLEKQIESGERSLEEARIREKALENQLTLVESRLKGEKESMEKMKEHYEKELDASRKQSAETKAETQANLDQFKKTMEELNEAISKSKLETRELSEKIAKLTKEKEEMEGEKNLQKVLAEKYLVEIDDWKKRYNVLEQSKAVVIDGSQKQSISKRVTFSGSFFDARQFLRPVDYETKKIMEKENEALLKREEELKARHPVDIGRRSDMAASAKRKMAKMGKKIDSESEESSDSFSD